MSNDSSPRVACLMMQKNEIGLLEAWIRYHGTLFGFENLFIFDNGSTSPAIGEIFERFKPAGITVDFSYPTRQHYRDRPDIYAALIERLEATGRYDFFLLLDCDEFVAKRTPAGLTVKREEILGYLATLMGDDRVLRVPYQFANHPRIPDLYTYFDFRKVFFAAGAFGGADHGNHNGVSRTGKGDLVTHLVHLHFHHRAFDVVRELAMQKWRGVESLTEVNAEYRGQSEHLPRYFRMSQEEYYGAFADAPLFYFPPFRKLLRELGGRIDMSVGVDKNGRHIKSADEALVGWSDPPLFGPLEDVGNDSRMSMFVPTQFNEELYFAANPDLQRAGILPLTHYCVWGFKETRRKTPG